MKDLLKFILLAIGAIFGLLLLCTSIGISMHISSLVWDYFISHNHMTAGFILSIITFCILLGIIIGVSTFIMKILVDRFL